jgi:hypothetical protein
MHRPGAIRKRKAVVRQNGKELWIEIWTYGMLYRSTWGIM